MFNKIRNRRRRTKDGEERSEEADGDHASDVRVVCCVMELLSVWRVALLDGRGLGEGRCQDCVEEDAE